MSNSQHIGIYPASFDPITIAHINIAERASRTLDKLYVAVAQHPSKHSMFTAEERLSMVRSSIEHIKKAEAVLFKDGFTVDYARSLGASVIIRGARDVTDFLDEVDLFRQNIYAQQAIGINADNKIFIDTQTYYTLPEHSHISSSLVRTIIDTPNLESREDRLRPLIPTTVYNDIIRSINS